MRLTRIMVSVVFIGLVVLVCRPVHSDESPEYDAVVIGAGGGGLAAAARLSMNGMKTLLLEQHYKVGGYMTNFERMDYTFDVSLHALDGLNKEYGMNRWLFRELEILDKVELVPLDPVYRATYPDITIDVPADVESYKALLISKFPHERKGIERLFGNMENMSYAIKFLIHMQDGERLKAASLFIRRPWFLKPIIKYSDKSLSEMLDDYIHDEKLRTIFSWLCFYTGMPPERLPAMSFIGMWTSYHYGGYFYVKGGSQAVSDALADVIESHGGDIKLSTLVTGIKIEDGRAVAVTTEDGVEYKCRYVVSNANAYDTLFKMVGEDNLTSEYADNIRSLEIGPSILVIYMGVDHDYSEVFAGANSISIESGYEISKVFDYSKQGLLDKMSYSVSNFTMKDPSFAPAGKNVITITTYMDYDWRDGWYEEESYRKYRKLKEEVAWALIKRAESVLPGLGSHVEVLEVGSPRTMEHFTLNTKGAVYGWANSIEQEDKIPGINTPIPNLFLAGAWSGAAGQNGVMRSGLIAADEILKMEGR